MGKAAPGKMIVLDLYGTTVYGEVLRITKKPDVVNLWDLKIFFKDSDPQFSTFVEDTITKDCTAVEISRHYQNRRSERVVTFEDLDGYSYTRTFKEF